MMTCRQLDTKKATSVKSEPKYKCLPWNKDKMSLGLISMMENLLHGKTVFIFEQGPVGRLNKKDGLTRYGDSHVKDKTSSRPSYL